MSTELVALAVVMFAVTYPTRAAGLLAPGIERLPRPIIEYLQLVGPAVLAALAAVAVMVAHPEDGSPVFHVGIEWLAVAACAALVVWRRNLLLGLVVAVAIVVLARLTGIAALPA
jgi:branched-subunit amino acid transport protein